MLPFDLRSLRPILLCAFAGLLLPAAAPAQYPLVPTPVLALGGLSHSLHFSGYISARDTHHGDSASLSINRARLTVVTAPLPYLAVRLQGDLSGGVSGRLSSDSSVHGFELTDAYVELAPPAADQARWGAWHPALIVGQFKQPFSLEYLTSFAYLRTANRSAAVDRLTPKRDIGVMGQVEWSRFVTLAGSVTNGEGSNALSNPDGRELVMGRLTLRPLSWLAVAGKLSNEGMDHARGYDARLEWRDLLVEGEAIHRSRPLSGGVHQDAGGGYVLAAYRVLPWLQPVLKREWLTDTRQSRAGATDSWLGWTTFGVNVLTPSESLRLQLDWVVKSQRPTRANNEADIQLIANF